MYAPSLVLFYYDGQFTIPKCLRRHLSGSEFYLKKADYDGINKALLSYNWADLVNGLDVNGMLGCFCGIIYDLWERYVPKKSTKPRNTRPCMSLALIRLRTLKRNLSHRVNRFGDPPDNLRLQNL